MEEAEKDLYEALTNLVQVADFSQLQLLIEKAEEIAPVLEEKYVPDEAAFAAFEEALENAKAARGKPTVIIARTVKGKGVDFMENNVVYHYASGDSALCEKAKASIMRG